MRAVSSPSLTDNPTETVNTKDNELLKNPQNQPNGRIQHQDSSHDRNQQGNKILLKIFFPKNISTNYSWNFSILRKRSAKVQENFLTFQRHKVKPPHE